jgi:Tfp pilus assembly protein PilN
MRPVNLIPPDERRGDSAPLRMGNLIYVLTAGLAVLLLGIVALALTGKQVSEREAKKATLQQELSQATAEAQSVKAFTDFRAVQQQRADTVSSLAQSRFDWSRVLHELALTMPSDIWLSSLIGTVNPEVQIASSGSGSSQSSLRANVAGPALSIEGCAPSQDAVAGFVSSLEDIDGVTRVGVESSKLPDQQQDQPTGEPGNATAGGSGDEQSCQTGPTIIKFEIVAAFDAVTTPPTATASPSVPASASPATGSDQSGVADVQTQEKVHQASVREQSAKAQQAAHNLNPEPGN